MSRRPMVPVFVIAAALAFASGLEAQARSPNAQNASAPAQPAGFSTSERQIIFEFFSRERYRAQPLPPGIAKNLARGKPLPPGIAKKQIPVRLRERLPTRSGVEISIFGDRIVLLEASGAVVDVLGGVFR